MFNLIKRFILNQGAIMKGLTDLQKSVVDLTGAVGAAVTFIKNQNNQNAALQEQIDQANAKIKELQAQNKLSAHKCTS